MANMKFHLKALNNDIQVLHQPATLLNILSSRMDIEELEPCEIQEALKGIERLLYSQIEVITDRVATMGGNDETH